MSDLLGWFTPGRWIALAVVLAALVGAYEWNSARLIAIGKEKCRSESVAKQVPLNDQATKEVVKTETLIEVRYRDRVKEVVKYEAPAGTSCIADPDFLRIYNAGGQSRDQ